MILGLASRDEVLILRDVVSAGDVFDADKSVSVLIHCAEGALNHGQFARGELVSEASNELFVRDVTISINIVGAHEALQVNLLGE